MRGTINESINLVGQAQGVPTFLGDWLSYFGASI